MNTRKYKPENAIFAKNLKYYIALSGKDQKQICADLSVSEASLSGYVNAQSFPRVQTLHAIANYFGVAVADLMENTEQNETMDKQELKHKPFYDMLENTYFTDEEFAELITFGKFLIAKRKD